MNSPTGISDNHVELSDSRNEMQNDVKKFNVSENKIKLCNVLSIWHVLVLLGTAFGTVIEGLVPHSFGTLIAHFKSINNTEYPSFYSASQFQLNWLPALSSAFPSILLPIFVIIVQRYSKFYQVVSIFGFLLVALSCCLSSFVTTWPILFITYSIIYSVGASLFLSVVIIITAEYFPLEHKYHVLATSLYQIGYPLAALIGNPILAKLIQKYEWQVSLRIIAGIQTVLGVTISCFMKPLFNKGIFNNNNNSNNNCNTNYDCQNDDYDSANGKTNEGVPCNNRSFSSMILSSLTSKFQIFTWLFGKYINYMCWYGLRTNVVTYLVKSTSFGLTNSASLMSVYAASEIVIAILASFCGDYFRGWLIPIHILSAFLLSILTGIYFVVLNSYLSAVLLMIGIGFSIQLSLSFGYPASVEVWSSKMDIKVGWVLTNVAAGLGIITSPLISGILMDKSGMKSLFYAQCTGWLLQLVLYTVTFLIMKSKQSPSSYERIDE